MRTLLLSSVLTLSISATALAQGFDQNSVSQTCKPCEDFYKYANELWLKDHPIPAAYPDWSPWHEIGEDNLKVLRTILETASKTGGNRSATTQKIGDYYFTAMDSAGIEKAGITPIKGELAKIESISNKADLIKTLAHLQKYGVSVPFSIGSSIDDKNSTRIVASLWQDGLGLPDKDYYFNDDPKSKELRDFYLKHISAFLGFAGESNDKASAAANNIFQLEKQLAAASMDRATFREPDSVYHLLTRSDLNTLTPNFDWNVFLTELGYPSIKEVILGQPVFFKQVDQSIAGTSLDTWKSYLKLHLLMRVAPQLDSRFVNQNFAFNKVLYGTKEMQPRWKRSVRSADNALGEALGQEYVRTAFPPSSKTKMMKMISDLKEALRSDLTSLPWIGNETRAKAIQKIETFMPKIGYPDKWKDYSSLTIDRSSFAQNSLRASEFEFKRQMDKIGKPVDRTEWGMTPPTINAYYNPSLNEIVFPAGILQPPFFDPSADDAYNYGAIGAVIGHEMTHGFDDNGAQYDAEGNLKNWWSEDDLKKFEAKAKCIIDQYSGFAIEDSIHVRGDQVVGESIADLGGVTLAYNAYLHSLGGKPGKVINGFTPEQRFFLGYARVWATNQRPEYAKFLNNVDFHPLGYFRVIGPLSNFPAFAKAFHCKEGDKMVRPADSRCEIW